MLLNVYEIFDKFVDAPTRPEKIDILRKYANSELLSVLRGAFDPRIKYIVDSIPPYKIEKTLPPGFGYTRLHQELDRIYLFEATNPGRPNVPTKRLREILIQMLEALEPREAEVLAGVLMKKLNVPGLDYAIVKEAFNRLLPDEKKEE